MGTAGMPSGGVPCEHRAVTRRYLKEASRPLNVADPKVGRRVAEMLVALEAGGEEEAASLAAEFDGWSGPIEVTVDEIASATGSLPPTVIRGPWTPRRPGRRSPRRLSRQAFRAWRPSGP